MGGVYCSDEQSTDNSNMMCETGVSTESHRSRLKGQHSFGWG